jgi:hypothetical protein
MSCRIFGKVHNPDGFLTSGRIVVYLRAKDMTEGQLMALDAPITMVAINPAGDIDFQLTPNAHISPENSFYEVHIFTKRTYWTEKWIIPDQAEITFDQLRNQEVAPWFFIEELKHEADTYNPHLTKIEDVLSAQPDFLIPAARIDFGGLPTNGQGLVNLRAPTFVFEVLFEGEVLFTVPIPFDRTDEFCLDVELNGLGQRAGIFNDYLMLDSRTIQFNRPLHQGEVVEIRVLKWI